MDETNKRQKLEQTCVQHHWCILNRDLIYEIMEFLHSSYNGSYQDVLTAMQVNQHWCHSLHRDQFWSRKTSLIHWPCIEKNSEASLPKHFLSSNCWELQCTDVTHERCNSYTDLIFANFHKMQLLDLDVGIFSVHRWNETSVNFSVMTQLGLRFTPINQKCQWLLDDNCQKQVSMPQLRHLVCEGSLTLNGRNIVTMVLRGAPRLQTLEIDLPPYRQRIDNHIDTLWQCIATRRHLCALDFNLDSTESFPDTVFQYLNTHLTRLTQLKVHGKCKTEQSWSELELVYYFLPSLQVLNLMDSPLLFDLLCEITESLSEPQSQQQQFTRLHSFGFKLQITDNEQLEQSVAFLSRCPNICSLCISFVETESIYIVRVLEALCQLFKTTMKSLTVFLPSVSIEILCAIASLIQFDGLKCFGVRLTEPLPANLVPDSIKSSNTRVLQSALYQFINNNPTVSFLDIHVHESHFKIADIPSHVRSVSSIPHTTNIRIGPLETCY